MSRELPPDIVALTQRPEPGPHRSTIVLHGRATETLADLPPLRNRLLFVGLAPSRASVEAGHYHQDPGHTFWRHLLAAGLLPADTILDTADDALLATGHGITDLAKSPAATSATSDRELREGVGALWQKVAIWRPGAIVFIEQRVAEIAAGRTLAEPWGQLSGVALAGRPCFLMPSADAEREQIDEGLNFLRNLAASLPLE